MQEAARLVSNLQTESDGVDLMTLLRETPREAYSFQQLGVRDHPRSPARPPPRSHLRSSIALFQPVPPNPPPRPPDLTHQPLPPPFSSSPPSQWPAEITSMRTHELPAVVLERYSTRQSVCFCGVFPEIRRAWATVDNALFLWRFDVPDDVPVEYSGEEQAIVSVGLAKPKPGVFLPSVERVLVVATTVEIVLLGVAFDRDGDGDGTADGVASADDLGARDLTLHALNYACTTDDVVVKDIASTESGRIFFAGDDEALYEVEYSGSDTWRARRCRKVCHHSAMPKLLPSILRLRAPDPLRQVLVDEYRCTLYTRSEGGAVNVFDLGPGCAETPRRVAEVRDVAAAAQMARGVVYSTAVGAGTAVTEGSTPEGRAAAPPPPIAPNAAVDWCTSRSSPRRSPPRSRSSRCARTDGGCTSRRSPRGGAHGLPRNGRRGDGGVVDDEPLRRIRARPARGGGASGPNGARRLVPAPTRLAVVASREPLPQGSAQRGMTSAQALRATTTARPLEVEAAYYGDGLMLLSDAADRDEDARLFMAARDLALPSHLQVTPANVTGAGGPGGVGGYVASSGLGGGASRSLRETVTAQQLAGRAASSVGSVGEVPPPPGVMRDLAPPFPDGAPSDLALAPRRLRSELATQHVAPRRKFVIVTNAGIVQLEKARPLDALCKLLASDVHEQMAHFFRAYGQAEAATMCLAIALGCSDAAAPETSDGFDYAAAGPGATLIGAGNSGFGRDAYPGNSGAGVVHGYAATIAEKARRALEDPRLTGEPHVDDDGPDAAGASSAAFDMGRPIVQPQLHHSGVHAALYTYAARVLAATWDRPLAVTLAKRDGLASARDWTPPRQPPRPPLADAVANGAAANGVKGAAEAAAGWLGGMLRPARGPGAPVACTLPADVLASLERRLRPLDAFLSRRRPRVVVDSHGARGVGLQPAKQRRRLEDGPAGALRAEEGSIAALRALLRRATQATALLRVVVESDFSRVASRLSEENLAELRRTTLRRLASTSEGARLASALVEALMAHRTREDRDGVEALAATLHAESPLFFGGDERAFYRARELLQAARDARDARDPVAARDRVGEALEMLLEVPLAGDPTATCAELADLRCFRGLVALPLAAAAAAADRAASRDDTLGAMTHDASIARDRTASDASFGVGSLVGGAPTPEECHEYVCVAIRALAAGTADPGAPPGSLGAVCASLDPDERAAGLTVMIERVAQASSPAAAAARAPPTPPSPTPPPRETPPSARRKPPPPSVRTRTRHLHPHPIFIVILPACPRPWLPWRRRRPPRFPARATATVRFFVASLPSSSRWVATPSCYRFPRRPSSPFSPIAAPSPSRNRAARSRRTRRDTSNSSRDCTPLAVATDSPRRFSTPSPNDARLTPPCLSRNEARFSNPRWREPNVAGMAETAAETVTALRPGVPLATRAETPARSPTPLSWRRSRGRFACWVSNVDCARLSPSARGPAARTRTTRRARRRRWTPN